MKKVFLPLLFLLKTAIVVFTFILAPNIASARSTIIPMTSLIQLSTSVSKPFTAVDDKKLAIDQPVHTIKFIRLAGSSSYEALCCPGLAEDGATNLAMASNSLDSTPDQLLPMTDITVYPNPASNFLIVKNAHGAHLYLFTCMGKQVYFATIDHEQPIDITSVPCGCYTLKLEIGNRFRSLQLHVRR